MNIDSAWETNLRDGLGIEQEAQTNRRAGMSGLWGLIWESILTDDLSMRVQGAYSRRPQHWYPWNCDHNAKDTCDFTPRMVQKFPRRIESQSNERHERWDLDVYQLAGQLQYFANSKALFIDPAGDRSTIKQRRIWLSGEADRARHLSYDREHALRRAADAGIAEPFKYTAYVLPIAVTRKCTS
jgi:hypothetical protein